MKVKINIEDFKLILLHKSFNEIEASIRDFDVASFDRNGNNILHYYVGNFRSVNAPVENTIQLFIDCGVDINARQSKLAKKTALHLAVLKKEKEIFDVLLKKGVNVNIQDAEGNAPLFNAVFGYHGDNEYFIETLIKNGALVDVVNNYGVSPKSLAGTIANYDTHKFFRK